MIEDKCSPQIYREMAGLNSEENQSINKTVKLADVVTPRNEKVLPIDVPELSFIGLDDIEAHTMKQLGSKVTSGLKSSAKRFYKGDLLYSRLRPYLNKVWRSNKDGICSSEFIVIPENENIDTRFLAYRLNATDFVAFANSLNAGDRPRVDFKQISLFEIPAFSLSQQQEVVVKIEELFSELDSGIASLKTAQEQLKTYRQAILKHAFEGNLTAQWRKENADQLETSEQLLARIQNERETRYQQQLNDWKKAVKNWEVKGKESKKPSKPKTPSVISLLESNLPHGWSMVSLDCLLTTERKPMATGPFGTALSKSEHQPCGVPVLGIENIGSGKFLPGNKIFVTESKTEELLAFKVHPEDIIISRSGTVGEICEVPKNVTNALISTNLLRVSLNSDVVLSPFFVLMFQGGGVKLQVKDLCKGSSREFLNQTILNSISYPICGLNEQKALLRELDAVFSIIDQQVKEVDIAIIRAETLRQSILKKAFSGLLVPQNSNDELASELLARVKAKSERT